MSSPRIAPGSHADTGRLNAGIARVLGAATGGGPPNIFTTLGRHRGLFRPWLRFAGRLMPGGLLPREDSELLILRVAHNCGCEYEWHHHERLGADAGLTREEIERVRGGPGAPGWSPRREVLLRAADELHAERTISNPVWASLRGLGLSDAELIEVCMLVGHYEMLAMTLNALAVQPDAAPLGSQPRAMRLLHTIARRRSGAGRSSR
ncbi:MAG: carboxymuconolactone decarboxylase family protein [Thermoleophilaceae bacterium]